MPDMSRRLQAARVRSQARQSEMKTLRERGDRAMELSRVLRHLGVGDGRCPRCGRPGAERCFDGAR